MASKEENWNRIESALSIYGNTYSQSPSETNYILTEQSIILRSGLRIRWFISSCSDIFVHLRNVRMRPKRHSTFCYPFIYKVPIEEWEGDVEKQIRGTSASSTRHHDYRECDMLCFVSGNRVCHSRRYSRPSLYIQYRVSYIYKYKTCDALTCETQMSLFWFLHVCRLNLYSFTFDLWELWLVKSEKNSTHY